MLISHGHSDHFGDAVDLAKKHNPKIVGMYELCTFLQKKGAKQIAPMNKGGTQQVGDIKVSWSMPITPIRSMMMVVRAGRRAVRLCD